MTVQLIFPVKQPDISVKLYETEKDFPSVLANDPNYGAFMACGFANGLTTINNRVEQIGSSAVRRFHYYNFLNNDFVYAEFSAAMPMPGMSIFPLRYCEQAGYAVGGFYTVTGTGARIVLFRTPTFNFNDGILPLQAMTLLFDSMLDPHFYSADILDTVTLSVFPGNGPLPIWAISFKYITPRGNGADYAYTVSVNPLVPSTTVNGSTFDHNPIITNNTSPILGYNTVIEYLGGSRYQSFEYVYGPFDFQISQAIWEPGSDPQAGFDWDQNYLVLDFPSQVAMSFATLTKDTNGFYYGTLNQSYFKFDLGLNTYTQGFYSAGDTIARNVLAAPPTNVDNILGYSPQDNAFLYVNWSSANPIVLTTNPRRTVSVGRNSGSKIPILKLPCENYCLPLTRYKG